MTNYRQTMSQALEYMHFIKEVQILERELTDTEIKRREEIAQDLDDQEFKDRYGKDWMQVKMGTATKMAKAEAVHKGKDDEEDEEGDEEEKLIRPGGLREKADVSLKKKAEKSGISASILKQVYNRGVAAWRTGHRPGTTPEQWGHARVNSFISKSSGTWGGADKDLAAKARGQKEEVEEAYKPVKNNHYDVKVTVSDREVDKVKSFIMNSSEYNNGEIEDVDTDQVDGGGQAFKGKGDIFIQGDGAGSLGVDLQKNFGRKIKVMGEGVELDEGKMKELSMKIDDVVAKMKKDRQMKGFADKFKKDVMKSMDIEKSLEKVLPDYIAGKDIQALVKEEVELDERMKLPRQLIDKNKEVMLVKKNKVIVVNKKDQDKYMKQGWTLAEELDEGKMQDVWQKKNAKSLSVGPFELIRGKGGVSTIKRSGKVIGDFSYDDEADNFVANIKGERAQWVGDDIDSLFTHLQKNHKEEVELDEAKYEIYHKDFSSAMQHAYKMAKKLHGITIDPKEIDDKVASGPRKPSSGKTNSYRLKGDKGAIQVQVYNMDNKKYELNMYKEEVELGESVVDKVKQVASKKQAMKIDGVMVDTFTASAISQIYDKVNDANKKKMDKLPITKLANLAMKMMQKNEFTPEELDDKDKPTVKKIIGKLKKASQAHAGQADTLQKAVDESAASDARRAMRRDPDMKQRGFSKDMSATDDDVKGASKNIMMQMRKAQSLRGRFDVEFADGKKVRIPEKVAIAVQQKYNAMRKPSDKEKFQAQVAKSYKSMLSALKEGFASDAQRKAAFASGYKEKGKKNKKESILDRIDNKLKERKNG